MFHWSNSKFRVVLSDKEELDLVRQLASSAVESAKYDFCDKTRSRLEAKINQYLDLSSSKDPESFYRTYCFRSRYGENAIEILPVILDGYARFTKRAVLGDFGEPPEQDDAALNLLLGMSEPPFLITLLERGSWFWSQPRISGRIFIPPSSIQKLAGTIDDFMVATNSIQIKFHRDFIRIWHKAQPIDEQAGTGQPATRPESKSEDGDQPQPESEGRSR